jgi:HD-like signal output (HDOD) protein
MPGMNGYEFLKHIKDRYPTTMRVALSGYTDSRVIYKALEENVAKMYMFKPWDNRELLNTIDKMFQLEEVLKDHKIMDLINNLNDLPTLPGLYLKIKQMIQDDEDVDRIAKLIESDQASTAKILRIANSAFYGAKTGSISQAIMYIGLSNVKSIVLSNALFSGSGALANSIKQLWINATLTNRMTNHLYQRVIGKKIPNVFASAGLLHNIGMVVLLSHFADKYQAVLQQGLVNADANAEQERNLVGVTHQELGGFLLNWWELPLPIVEAALYHHTPLDERIINRELMCVIHLANAEAWRVMGETPVEPPQTAACCEVLGISPENVAQSFSEIERISDLLD